MRIGVNYDTGFRPGGDDSRPDFVPADVERDMRIIATELHSHSVRVTGADPARIELAAVEAARAGLAVWFAPFPCELDVDEMSELLVDCAIRAQRLRDGGADVVLVLGCELSMFAQGFVPGASFDERIGFIMAGGSGGRDVRARLNEFLGAAAALAHRHFDGPVTYAAGSWEGIDWTPFDIVAVDAYRDEHNAATFAADLQRRQAYGKPVAVTEFGSCTYRGASRRGGMGWMIVDRVTGQLDGDYIRDEAEQAGYLTELLDCFAAAGVADAFWFTYANWNLTSHAGPRADLDLASYGLLRLTDAGRERKQAFDAFARYAERVNA